MKPPLPPLAQLFIGGPRPSTSMFTFFGWMNLQKIKMIQIFGATLVPGC
jgi:hypothetical protein